MDEDKTYRTSDLYESTALLLAGISLIRLEPVGRTCFFLFSDSPQLQEIRQKYILGQLAFEPRRLFDVWRKLRTAAFTSTGDIRG